MTKQQTVGERLATLLAQRGVTHIFGIPGVHTVEMYRGLPDSGVTHITPRHEQGAGFMADGYARATGKPGVCFVITGPGLTNIFTAMGQAYGDSVPMLVISAVNAQGRMGTGEGWLHELPDQSAMAEGVAAFSRTIHTPDMLDATLDEAFALFATARPRPVHIEIPTNVLQMPCPDVAGVRPATKPPVADEDTLSSIAADLSAAQRPVLLVGGGARHAPVALLAEKLDAPAVMTTNARGALPARHPLAVSVSASLSPSRELIAQADVVLAIGTEMGRTDYDFYEDNGMTITGHFHRIDIDPAQSRRNLPLGQGIAAVSDASAAVEKLVQLVAAPSQGSGAKRALAAQSGIQNMPAAVQADIGLLESISHVLPDSLIVGDSTQITYSATMGFNPKRSGGFWSSSTGFGTLGYGLPAAIGASLEESAPVVGIIGDGGLQFSLAELSTGAEIGANVILIVHDNKGYGEIKSFMTGQGIEPQGVDIFTPDLCKIAEACGWKVIKVNDDFKACLKDAAGLSGPVMLYLDEAARQASGALL